MSIELNNMPTTTTDVAVTILDQSKLIAEPSLASRSPDGNTVKAVYLYAGTSAASNTRVEVSSQYVPNQDVCRHSIRLVTTEVNDASGEDVVLPIEALIAWNTPGRFMGDPGKVLAMLGALYSLTFTTLDTKVPNVSLMNAFDLPVVSSLY